MVKCNDLKLKLIKKIEIDMLIHNNFKLKLIKKYNKIKIDMIIFYIYFLLFYKIERLCGMNVY